MPRIADLIRLARPTQWSKGVFVLVGPLYGLRAAPRPAAEIVRDALIAFLAFGLASSACYIINDILDADADRHHSRKRRRPIPSGAVSVPAARVIAGVLLILSGLAVLGLPVETRPWLAGFVALYAGNVLAYSLAVKHIVVLDVMSLSLGFVLRVLGGCAAAGVTPSTWLLNCTFFLAMFLAFGKRLGERRTLGAPDGQGVGGAAAARAVQRIYTDEILRMVVVVTGVICLVTYGEYVQSQSAGLGPTRWAQAHWPFNLFWLTMLPATYGLLRCIVLLEDGRYDDPTELAVHDRPFQLAAVVFAGITAVLVWTGGGTR